jgi:chitinase
VQSIMGNKKFMLPIKNSLLQVSLLLLLSGSSAWVCAQQKVIGYIASFNDMTATIDATDLSKLTHINISFANPDANGDLVVDGALTCMSDGEGVAITATELQSVIDKAQAGGVKVLISVAGGVIPSCSGNWADMLKPENRGAVVEKLITFMEDFNLDGIDVDIEGVLLTNIDNAGNYTPFIEALSTELKERNKLLTCATASYVGGMIPVSSIPYFDFVNIMAYDAIGPSWGTPGVQHSTYAMAAAHVELWKERGLAVSQLVLGVPFYGYGFKPNASGVQYDSDYNFSRIVAEFGTDAANNDLIGTACASCNYITYNGIPTIRAKTQLAMAEGSGVMIWELSQDGSGANSLLAVIDDEINNPSGTSSSAASSVSSAQSSVSSVESSVASSSLQSSSAASSRNNSGGGGGGLGLLILVPLAFGFRRVLG